MTDRRRTSAFKIAEWTYDEKRFCDYLDIAIRERHNATFYNEGTFHAVHLIHRFFLCAKKELRIFSGALQRRVNDEKSFYYGMLVYEDWYVLKAVKAFLSDKDTSLKVVVEEDGLDGGLEDHPLVEAISELERAGKLKGSCEILQFSKGRKDELTEKKGRAPHHMIIMDQTGYRVEIDPDDKTAKVNLDDRSTAKKLVSIFDNDFCDGAVKLWALPAAK